MMRNTPQLRIGVSPQLAQLLQGRADYEGRSLSSLIAQLLEMACRERDSKTRQMSLEMAMNRGDAVFTFHKGHHLTPSKS